MTQQQAGALVDTKKEEIHTPEIITTQEEYSASMLSWKERHYNLLTPFAKISGLAPAHGVIATVVTISIDLNDAEAFTNVPYLKKDQYALAKRGLRKVAEGIGISTQLEYLSVNQIRHYWHVKAIASYRGIDGATVTREGSQEWDLRDGSERLKGWTNNQIDEGRKYGLRNCETRAINAAIRECGCGIKQAYYRDELARAFVAVRVVLKPDMTDPDQKRAVIQAYFGAKSLLYPASSGATETEPASLPEPETVTPAEPVEVMQTDAMPDDAEGFDLPSTEVTTEKAQDDIFHVAGVKRRGKDAAAQYFVETQEGVTLFTLDLEMAKVCKAAAQDGHPRTIPTARVQVGGKTYRQIIEIAAVGGLKL